LPQDVVFLPERKPDDSHYIRTADALKSMEKLKYTRIFAVIHLFPGRRSKLGNYLPQNRIFCHMNVNYLLEHRACLC